MIDESSRSTSNGASQLEEAISAFQGEALAALDEETVLRRALNHHLLQTGSQTRSQLTLDASRALGLSRNNQTYLAAAVECLHNASLIQDDLQDHDARRRGQDSVWSKFGANVAINLTDLLIATSFSLLARVDIADCVPELLTRMQRAVALTLQGQSRDLDDEDITRGIKTSLAVAESKSGPFFALCLELPLIAARKLQSVESAQQAGNLFGAGYQVLDDIQDAVQDKTIENSANVVVVFNEILSEKDAYIEAQAVACHYLERAQALAETLPNNCAALLVDHCISLVKKVKEPVK
jgi:geranylgeranyl pyrophosphate synthase